MWNSMLIIKQSYRLRLLQLRIAGSAQLAAPKRNVTPYTGRKKLLSSSSLSMRLSSSSFHRAAAAAASPFMPHRPTYRRGRNQSPAGFSGGGRRFFNENSGFRPDGNGNVGFRRPGESDSYARPQNVNPWPETFHNQLNHRPPPINWNSPPPQPPPPNNSNHPFRPQFRPQFQPQFRPQFQPQFQHPQPRHSRHPDYRIWEYARDAPPPHSEKFLVLSYNILADYLAMNHRGRLYNHIPPIFLDWQTRKRSIIFELGLWSADIMCLQEVDRFPDLEVELKCQGYLGLWKMRTGAANDGCAIFWRASRFKLLHDEFIEYNKLGLRDNVAQICVFELISENGTVKSSTSPSSKRLKSKQVVICNIHVLYNPRRGEIKLGQVRQLLERAHSVSQMWSGAPVVLCGDFNCTPKSSLYNFISEQKLNLTEVDRDKVSGQASAEIHAVGPRFTNPRRYADKSNQVMVTHDSRDPGLKQNGSNNSAGLILAMESLPELACETAVPVVPEYSCLIAQHGDKNIFLSDDMTEQKNSDTKGTRIFLTDPNDSATDVGLIENLLKSGNRDGCPVAFLANGHHGEPKTGGDSDNKTLIGDITEAGHQEKDDFPVSDHESISQHIEPHMIRQDEYVKCDEVPSSCAGESSGTIEASSSGSSAKMSVEVVNDDKDVGSTSCQLSLASTDSDHPVLDEKSDNYLNVGKELDGISGEDCDEFLSKLHGNINSPQSNFDESQSADIAKHPSYNNPVIYGIDSVPVEVERAAYDPSKWTALDIATASGNADCTALEHALKLKSTYVEAEDHSGTRDSNGEPMVTSYNRCFLGTVDYIWRSEGLQTVRVLAPIRKDVMQRTLGYPTKKWGSDHIALASELAFSEDVVCGGDSGAR